MKLILSVQKEFKVAFYFLHLDPAKLSAALVWHLSHRYAGSVAALVAAFSSAFCINVDSCGRCPLTCSEPEYKLLKYSSVVTGSHGSRYVQKSNT